MAETIRTFSDIMDGARAALAGLEESGVRTEHTRFARYLRDAAVIEQTWQDDGGQRQIDRYGIYSNLVSLSEADMAGRIWESLSGQPENQAELIRKLQLSLGGPVLPEQEKPGSGSNQARDIYFELVLAARCARAGLPVRLGESPDLLVQLGTVPLHIECKRVSSATGLGNATRKAARQLDVSLAGDPAGYGVLALDCGKLVGLTDVYIGQDQSDIMGRLLLRRRAIAQHEPVLRSRLRAVRNDRIVGVLFYFATFAYNQSTGTWSAPFSLEVARIHDRRPAAASPGRPAQCLTVPPG